MKSYYKNITNLKTIIISLVILLAGVALLFLSERLQFQVGYFWLKASISNLGGLLVATISIAILWELFSKRAFLNELLEKTGFAEDIKIMGICGISINPVRGPNFNKLIREAARLDIFVCYANTWRATYEEDLKFLANKKNCRIRLIVPDPDNMEIMKDLACRFMADETANMSEKIRNAISEYKSLFNSVNNKTLDFSVWVHQETPVTSFYRFDRNAVITLYKHAKGRGNAPTIIAERGGSLYSYIETEIDALINGAQDHNPLARKIYSSSKQVLQEATSTLQVKAL